MKKVGKILLIIVVVFIAFVLLMRWINKRDDHVYDPTENFAAFTWPESELVNRIPKPETIYGEINHEESGSFSADLGNVTRDQFNKYMESCIDAGFTVDYHKSSDVYWAYDADGYYLYISYRDEYKTMDVSIREPEEETTTSATDVTTTTTATDVATTTTVSSGGMNADFKAAMDAYEAFIDEYVEIIKKYTANLSDMTLLTEYTDYLSRYADVCNTFAEWEDEDLTNDELAYYIDVQARVSKKLLEVAQ